MMAGKQAAAIDIVAVDNRSALRDFIEVPWSIYRDDPAWVPPLRLERRQHLSDKNPFFQHARWQAWLAVQDGRPVGRVSAQIDQLFLERYDLPCGYFGMLEAGNDAALFQKLLNTAEDWLRQEGMSHVRGPFNLSINEECGLLVEGFETPPYLMMGHARDWYGGHIESCGYRPAKDLLAYQIHPDFPAPPVMTSLLRKTRRRATIRLLNRKRLAEDLEILRDIFNDAWSGNWGFVPFTAAEFREIGRNLTMLVKDDFIQIAEIDGEPVAFMVALPNVNEIIADLDGRLLPIGWLKLLWRLKVKYPHSARIPLMGVRRRFHNSFLGPGLAFLVIDEVRQALVRRGISTVEMSWILEDNAGMRNIIETIGGQPYKRYRIYEKSLLPA